MYPWYQDLQNLPSACCSLEIEELTFAFVVIVLRCRVRHLPIRFLLHSRTLIRIREDHVGK
jgi:hypothetical protein